MTGSAPLVERLEPAGDPAELAATLLDLPYPIFLDSATGLAAGEPHHLGRYSFLSADPVLVVRSKGPVTEVLEDGRARRVEGDALAVVRRARRSRGTVVSPTDDARAPARADGTRRDPRTRSGAEPDTPLTGCAWCCQWDRGWRIVCPPPWSPRSEGS